MTMDDLDELWRALDRIATTPRLLVACDFDGGLAPDLGDPDDARAEQLSSEALNILLDDIRKFPLKKANMDPLPLNEDVVSRLNVTGKNFGIGMLRNGGKLDWPTGLDFVAPETKSAIDRLTQKLVASALQGKVDRQLLEDINGRMEEIRGRLVKMVNEMPAGPYFDADRFLVSPGGIVAVHTHRRLRSVDCSACAAPSMPSVAGRQSCRRCEAGTEKPSPPSGIPSLSGWPSQPARTS